MIEFSKHFYRWDKLGKTQDLFQELESHANLKELEINGRKYVLSYYEGEFVANL